MLDKIDWSKRKAFYILVFEIYSIICFVFFSHLFLWHFQAPFIYFSFTLSVILFHLSVKMKVSSPEYIPVTHKRKLILIESVFFLSPGYSMGL